MAWIKRNLYFVIGSVVALALMGVAGYYLFSKWQYNNQALEKLNAEYAELDRLNKANPHPGSPKIDNIAAAKEQQAQLRQFIQRCRTHFQRIPPIPDVAKVTDSEFSSALSRTIYQLSKDATNLSVTLPASYNFTFQAQRQILSFAAGSLEPLSTQLGEVKVICDILFKAKINSLENFRRERVSSDDQRGPQTDYLEQKSVTNELAVLTPYEVTFRCFSPELASVLGGLASSPYGLLVKTINVEAAPAAAPAEEQPAVPPPTVAVPYSQPVTPPSRSGMEDGAFARRYGLGRSRYGPPPVQAQPQPQPAYVVPAATPTRTGLPVVLDEKQLKVTLTLQVVKLLAPPPNK